VDQLVDYFSLIRSMKRHPQYWFFLGLFLDKELFRTALEKLPANSTRPQLRIFQTQDFDDPYIVTERATYQAQIEESFGVII